MRAFLPLLRSAGVSGYQGRFSISLRLWINAFDHRSIGKTYIVFSMDAVSTGELQMDLKFSHVDVLVKNLDEACAYYAQILNARISKSLVWERGGLHVRYAIALMGQERFMLVQPLAGNLKELLDTSGEGMIYRHCYSTPDIEKAYDELMAAGVQPEKENGRPLARTCNPRLGHASFGCPNASGTSLLRYWKTMRWRHLSRLRFPKKTLQRAWAS